MKSAALQWAALCVCPPAILATSVATVPSIKRAAHHATRPAPAKHKLAQAKKAPTPVRTASAGGLPCDALPTSAMLAYANDFVVDAPEIGDPGALPTINPKLGPTPVAYSVDPNIPINQPFGNVPEPATWLMMIAGFGFVGMGLRWRRGRGSRGATPVIGDVVRRRRRRTRTAGGASTLMASLGFGEIATGTASMATIAAKTMLCVCPTVAMVGATMATPKLRAAVYKATTVPAPRLAATIPVKPPCDPSLRSADATPSSRIITGAEASPKMANALLASTSTSAPVQGGMPVVAVAHSEAPVANGGTD